MAETFLAIDLGSSNISIYRKDYGFVLKEPCLVGALQTQNGYDVKYMGNNAKAMLGKTDERTVIFSPTHEAQVKSPEYLALLLKNVIGKIAPKKLIFNGVKCLVPYASGLDSHGKENIKTAFKLAGIHNVILLPKGLCSAYGMGANPLNNSASLVLDIGGGSIDVSVVSMGSVISGYTLGLGGKSVDHQIVKIVKEKYGVEIGISYAQKLKEEIGSLFSNDTANMEIVGMDVKSKVPTSVVVYATDVKMAVMPLLEEAVRITQTTLNSLSPELSADIIKNGIYVCGGMSKVVGLERYLRKELNLPIIIKDESENATILGAGKLLADKAKIQKMASEV